MNLILQFIGIGWFACLFVQLWEDITWKTKYLRTLKPFSCQMCMGFWMGCVFFFRFPVLEIIIFASMSSFSAVILYHLSAIIAKKNL